MQGELTHTNLCYSFEESSWKTVSLQPKRTVRTEVWQYIKITSKALGDFNEISPIFIFMVRNRNN